MLGALPTHHSWTPRFATRWEDLGVRFDQVPSFAKGLEAQIGGREAASGTASGRLTLAISGLVTHEPYMGVDSGYGISIESWAGLHSKNL